MNMLSLMCVAIGGAFGSMCRFGVMSLIGRVGGGQFPWGTFAVNIAGSFLMGVWIAVMACLLPARTRELHLLIAVGVLGGFTTFSTFSIDTYLLIERGLFLQAALYIVGSVVLSVVGLFAGMWLIKVCTG